MFVLSETFIDRKPMVAGFSREAWRILLEKQNNNNKKKLFRIPDVTFFFFSKSVFSLVYAYNLK